MTAPEPRSDGSYPGTFSRRRWTCLILVLGPILGCVLYVFLLLTDVISRPKTVDRGSRCNSNLRQLSMGLVMYAEDYDDHLPPAHVWADTLFPYVKNSKIFVCLSAQRDYGGLATHYGFNSLLGERRTEDIPAPADCPMLFESSVLFAPDMRRNVTNPLTSFVARHRGTGHIAYADGHVRAVKTPPDAYAGLAKPKDAPESPRSP